MQRLQAGTKYVGKVTFESIRGYDNRDLLSLPNPLAHCPLRLIALYSIHLELDNRDDRC